MIEIHPKARENYNIKAEELLSLVKEIKIDESNKKPASNSELYTSAIITDKDIIGEIKFSYRNGFGEDKGRAFHQGKQRFGIIDKNYEIFSVFARNIYSYKSINEVVSLKYIKENLFDWIKATYLEGMKLNYCDYLVKGIEENINDYVIWVPVPFTIISKPFRIGKIFFQTLTEKNIDEWFNFKTMSDVEDPIQSQNIEKLKLQIKEDFQGYAVGIFKCKAEASRAEELAFENISNSLSMLRVFSPANLAHEIINGAYEYGHKMMRTKSFFISKDEGISYTSGVIDNLYWGIKPEDINWMSGYFKKLDGLLNVTEVNKFQEKVFESLVIYSKSSLKLELSDRILYTLVALETMLLKNTSEPIQQSIGERLAFIIGEDVNDKKDIVKNIKDTYAIRSKFIHHGVIIEENTELLRKFMLTTWQFFLKLISLVDKYNSKDEFLDDIDLLKYS